MHPDYALRFPLIGKMIRNQGRYYLVHHVAALRRDLLKLKLQLWCEFMSMTNGAPTTGIAETPCNTASGPICLC